MNRLTLPPPYQPPPQQLLYLILLLGSFSVYMWHGWARMPERDLVISQALVLCCLYTFKLACGVSPGRISKGPCVPFGVMINSYLWGRCVSSDSQTGHLRLPSEEWRRFDNYHHDPAVYEEGKECPTCKVPKYVLPHIRHARLACITMGRLD